MSRPRLSRSMWFIGVSAAALLLAACPPAQDEPAPADSTDAGQTRRNQEVGARAIVVGEAMPTERMNCLSRSFSRGSTVAPLGGKDTLTISPHDATVDYDLATLEQGEHVIAKLVAHNSASFPDYAVAPGDSSCWAIRAKAGTLVSVFYGRDRTVESGLTIELHTKRHPRADADWIEERRYEFNASTQAYAEDSTESGGSGPWSTCTRYGCCKPR